MQHQFGIRGVDNVAITTFSDWEDYALAAARGQGDEERTERALMPATMDNLVKRLAKDGANNLHLFPMNV